MIILTLYCRVIMLQSCLMIVSCSRVPLRRHINRFHSTFQLIYFLDYRTLHFVKEGRGQQIKTACCTTYSHVLLSCVCYYSF